MSIEFDPDLEGWDFPSLPTADSRSSFWRGRNVALFGKKISPHVDWRVKETSRIFATAGMRSEAVGIGGINGINTLWREAQGDAGLLGRYAGAHSVDWVYNCSHSLPMDVAEAVFLNYGGFSPPSDLLKERWLLFHRMNRDHLDAKYLQFCHSQGAIYVKNALRMCPEEVRKRVIVVAIAPAAIIPKSLCFDSYNYASKRDVVQYGEILIRTIFHPLQAAAEGFHLNELILLEPHAQAPLFDHAWGSPTFQEKIAGHVEDYLRRSDQSSGENAEKASLFDLAASDCCPWIGE